MAAMVAVAALRPWSGVISALFLIFLSFPALIRGYRPGDIVRMSKMGQYHSSRTTWHDVIGKHCPIFAVNREALIPIAKPMGYTGADPYKIQFQVGSDKFLIPWLLVINRKSSEVPMIDVNLRYSGGDLLGVTAQVIDMPHSYVNTHPEIRKQFWDPEHWPKHVLVRYTCLLRKHKLMSPQDFMFSLAQLSHSHSYSPFMYYNLHERSWQGLLERRSGKAV